MIIYVCSPLNAPNYLERQANILKAAEYCKFVMTQGHTPYAPHVFFTQFLDDSIDSDRQNGVQCGLEMLKVCNELWVFGKKVSHGMQKEIADAEQLGIPVVYTSI